MITLCYTQILLRRLRIAKPDLASMPPTNALRNWYANLICIGLPQMVMATSERSFGARLVLAARSGADGLHAAFCGNAEFGAPVRGQAIRDSR